MKRMLSAIMEWIDMFNYSFLCMDKLEQPQANKESADPSFDGFGYSVKDATWYKQQQLARNIQWSDMAMQYAKAEGMRNMNRMLRTMKQKPKGFYDVYLCNNTQSKAQ